MQSRAPNQDAEFSPNIFYYEEKCPNSDEDRRVFCKANGEWNAPSECVGCSSLKPNFENVEKFTAVSYSSLAHLFANMIPNCRGKATSWIFYSLTNHHLVYIGIYRKQNDVLTRVMESRIWATKGINHYQIPTNQQVQILPTDLISIRYPDFGMPDDLYVIPYAGVEELEMRLVDRLYDAYIYTQPVDMKTLNLTLSQTTVKRAPMLVLVADGELPETEPFSLPNCPEVLPVCRPFLVGSQYVGLIDPNKYIDGSSFAVITPDLSFNCTGTISVFRCNFF